MVSHHHPLTPNTRALLGVALVGLSAVAVDLWAVFDLVRPAPAEGNVLAWGLWVCATPVAAALAVLVARDRLTTSS